MEVGWVECGVGVEVDCGGEMCWDVECVVYGDYEVCEIVVYVFVVVECV